MKKRLEMSVTIKRKRERSRSRSPSPQGKRVKIENMPISPKKFDYDDTSYTEEELKNAIRSLDAVGHKSLIKTPP